MELIRLLKASSLRNWRATCCVKTFSAKMAVIFLSCPLGMLWFCDRLFKAWKRSDIILFCAKETETGRFQKKNSILCKKNNVLGVKREVYEGQSPKKPVSCLKNQILFFVLMLSS